MKINGYEMSEARQEFPENHWHHGVHFRNSECIPYNCKLLTVDHRDLLKKYLAYVVDYEGTDFLMNRPADNAYITFTEEEWNELQTLSRETDG